VEGQVKQELGERQVEQEEEHGRQLESEERYLFYWQDKQIPFYK